MAGWLGPTLARAAARLVALAVLLASLLPIHQTSVPSALATGCTGDEQILVAPTQPTVGSMMIVAALSSAAHEEVLLLGPDGPLAVERQPAGERYVWLATVTPERAGEHLFAFNVATGGILSLTACADALALVEDAAVAGPPAAEPDPLAAAPEQPPGETSPLVALLNPYGRNDSASGGEAPSMDAQAGPVGDPADNSLGVTSDGSAETPAPTDTPRPTRTPRRAASSANGNENDNNDNEADPTPTRTPTLARTPTPTRTPRPNPTDTPMPLATEPPPPTATRTPRASPTDTPEPTQTPEPTATRTPRPDPSDTPTRAPTATRTPRPDPTDTPVPTPTPTMDAPAIVDWSPASAKCRESLTIRGQRFGSSRSDVNGRVLIDGVQASIIAWEMTRIEVTVPREGVQPGNDRELLVVVAGKTTRASGLRISC